MPSRVVRPETTKLSISGGDWLLVKKRLTHGEQQAAFARRYVTDVEGAKVNLLQHTGLALITSYLLDWSLTDLEDKPLGIRGEPISVVEAHLNAIDPGSFDEIRDAIRAHEAAMDAERDAQKKIHGGEPASSPISPSPSDAIGSSTGSVN
jgi:hypothetical protein